MADVDTSVDARSLVAANMGASADAMRVDGAGGASALALSRTKSAPQVLGSCSHQAQKASQCGFAFSQDARSAHNALCKSNRNLSRWPS
mmetsp:Transcript_23203/g.53659  ORF Transcript_23203/g.53659 Transcript_23203/m.53659 type:complete len:89 (-) Transcript_23203:69-335(-)